MPRRALKKQLKRKTTRTRATIFLDRDGVINVDRRDYVKSWDEFQFLPKVFDALRLLKKNKIRVIIVTNQSAVNRGLMTLDDLNENHAKMLEEIRSHGGDIEAIYFCPHRPDEDCGCRKPKPGLVRQATADLGIDLARSYLVGDSEKDLDLARALRLKYVHVSNTQASGSRNRALWRNGLPIVVGSLFEAVGVILDDLRRASA
jgi:D-glycero-D-manno-heptose 1,7-bisphosphate phosphatase